MLSWKYSNVSIWRKVCQVWQLLFHLQQLYVEFVFLNAQTQCSTNPCKDNSMTTHDKTNNNIMHIPFFTVRCTAMYVSKPSLSTAHQYLPVSDRWSWLKVTDNSPLPKSTKVILSTPAFWPGFTGTNMSALVLHGYLQRYLLFANLCEHWNERSPPSTPTLLMSAPSVHVLKWHHVSGGKVPFS